jgi:ABC-type proline/glycine betaine transport system substrate-binding protein
MNFKRLTIVTKKFHNILFGIVLLSTIFSTQAFAKTTLVLADSGWDSQKLHNALVSHIVEKAYGGYKLKTSTASTPMNWQALIAGDVDLDLECWTENMATFAEDVKNGDVVEIGISVPNSNQGIYVPRYVIEGDPGRGIKPIAPSLKTVKDLAKYSHLFPDEEDNKMGRFYGGTPGWAADIILYKKYKLYGLDKHYNYVRLGSEATLFASLEAAYNLGEAWVGYCFEPTVISGKLDIVRLEDEPFDKELFKKGATEFNPQELHIIGSRYFAKKAPELIDFLKKYRTDSNVIAKGLAYINDKNATHKQAAIWILKTYPELIDEWLPKDKAEKIKKTL